MMRQAFVVTLYSFYAMASATAAEDAAAVVPIDDTLLFRRLEEITANIGQELPCDLECKNGGTCHYIDGSLDDWKYLAQTGILVQRCRCPPGFDGVGCEIPVEKCNEQTLTCELSGKPCDQLPDVSYTCACHVADAVDKNFAGNSCRRWNTEYCAGRLDEQADQIYLCTNGGKCQSDFIGAAIAPGDMAVNLQYQDAGCVCNENFYGPHCEFLKFGPEHNVAQQPETRQDVTRDENDGLPVRGVAIGLLCGALVGVLFMIARRRRQRVRAWKSSGAAEGVFKDADEANYSDNGTFPADDEKDKTYMDAITGQQELVDVSLHEEDDDDEDMVHDPLEAPAATPVLAKATTLQENDDEVDEENKMNEGADKDDAGHHFLT